MKITDNLLFIVLWGTVITYARLAADILLSIF